MENRAARRGIIRLTVLLLCAFMTVSLLISCDDTGADGGEYKDPIRTDNGSEKTEEDDTSESGTDADGTEDGTESDTESDNKGGIPTVEFPYIPFN